MLATSELLRIPQHLSKHHGQHLKCQHWKSIWKSMASACSPPNRTRCLDDSIWSKVLKLVISAENLWTPNCSKIINQPKETQAARLRESPKKQFEQRRFMTILLTPELHRDCTCLRLKCASKAKLHVETFHLSVSVSRWPSKSINIVCQIHTSAAWTPTLFN